MQLIAGLNIELNGITFMVVIMKKHVSFFMIRAAYPLLSNYAVRYPSNHSD